MTHVLEDNVFEFNGAFFTQIKGTAMGTKMAPASAGLFMAKMEKEFIESQDEETKTASSCGRDSSTTLWLSGEVTGTVCNNLTRQTPT